MTKLDDETIKAIWNETETGAINSDDAEHVPIDYLSFMLETVDIGRYRVIDIGSHLDQ